jgi:hypothetical protein
MDPAAFPEYSGDGDRAGARRMRRSFRWCVLACVLFTAALWISERYLRYDLIESQYMLSLTLDPESARAVLRQVVKRDAEQHEFPTPKYLAALAEREEDDLVLPTYERAHKLDPANSFLGVRYGCRLFVKEQYQEARDRFREAALQFPQNALPRYLEAAALPWCGLLDADLSDSLALIAQTNGAADKVLFPQPWWSPDLPQRGVWYSRLRRQIVDECCAPLYRYADLVVSRAKRSVTLQQVQSWDSWLQTLQAMGARLAAAEAPGSLQATAGIRIQLAALDQRQAVIALEQGAPDPQLAARKTALESGLALLNEFENSRDTLIAADKIKYGIPLQLCWKSAATAFAVYLLSYVLSRAVRAQRNAWALPHGSSGLAVLLSGSILLLALLSTMAVLQCAHAPAAQVGSRMWSFFARGWWVVFVTMVAFGFVYPRLRLPSPRTVIRNRGLDETDGALTAARRTWRVAYASFMRRYFGILCGLLLGVISFWAVGYRILVSLYPWQLDLLVTGLAQEEAQVLAQVIKLLS